MPNNWQRWKGIMKCYPFEEKRLAKWKPPYMVQPKLDGVRCRAVSLQDGNYLLLSSEENPIFSVPHVVDKLNSLHLNIELDGELYRHGMSFEEIVSITSRTVNMHPDHKEMEFHVYDIIRGDLAQMARIPVIAIVSEPEPCPVRAVPYWVCESLEDVMKAYDSILEQGYEGIVVRNLYAPYERKRSRWVMKFKPKKEDIYEITGWEEEISKEGIPKDRLGSLLLSSQKGERFSVGTGLSDDDRDRLWKERSSLTGNMCRVQYQHLTSGRKVPRFPVFVEVIDDNK